jgi:mRNA degradation ribonuclease J1/J2
MIVDWQEQLRPGAPLREIVQQATVALVAMDAERLEELAKCCMDLNREIESAGETAAAAVSLREAESDVKLLGRVLYETRANLTVLSRLHALRLGEANEMQSSPTSRIGRPAPYGLRALQGLSKVERTAHHGDN